MNCMNQIEAIAQIDHANFVLRKIQEDMEKHNSLVERAVDSACGVDKERKEAIIYFLQQIIEGKKFLQQDYSREEKYLSDIQKLEL